MPADIPRTHVVSVVYGYISTLTGNGAIPEVVLLVMSAVGDSKDAPTFIVTVVSSVKPSLSVTVKIAV